MSLLNELLLNPLDAAYREETAHPGASSRSPFSRIMVLLLAVVCGLGTVVAVKSLRTPNAQGVNIADTLREQVVGRQDQIDALEEEIAALNAQIRAISHSAPGTDQPSPELELVNATVPVTGTGTTITLSDAQDSAVEDASRNSRVRDSDIRLVVNALWQAGAEAISVNDQRLGPGTTVRTAGDTILVALDPVSSPYTIRALGDPDALTAAVSSGTTGDYLSTQTSTFGIGLDVRKSDSITMDALELRTTQSVQTADGKDAD